MPHRKPAPADEGRSSSQKPRASWYAQGKSDGLGDRLLMFDNSEAPSLELLRFRQDFAQVPGFEAALKEQVQRLARFRHPGFATIRSVQRLEPDDDLALISNCTPGTRLSEILHQTRGPAFAAAMIQQLAPALIGLQQHDAGFSHGILSADRIIVSPEGRLTIVEHVVGPAIDTLGLRRDQLSAIGIALPPGTGGAAPRLDAAAAWYQLGLVAVSVLLGRPVTARELPQLGMLLDRLEDSDPASGPAVSPSMRQWLDRALHISGSRIGSGADGREALEELLQKAPPGDVHRVDARRREPTRPAAPVTIGPPAPAPVRREALTATSGHQLPTPGRALFDQAPARLGAAPRAIPPPATRAATDDDRAVPQGRSRRTNVASLVAAALGLIAAVEVGLILGVTRPLSNEPRPPIVVKTAASGEDVLVSTGATGAAPLRLAVAPDMRWVRVTTTASAGTPGAKGVGTIQISSPIELQVFERARLLGSVPGGRLEIEPGRHDIELVNLALGYRLRQSVEVEAGQTVSIHVAPSGGWVTADAVPWADVSIDGRAAGRTPLMPLALAPGDHEVTFRHPSLGGDRQRVTIRSDATTRVTARLRH